MSYDVDEMCTSLTVQIFNHAVASSFVRHFVDPATRREVQVVKIKKVSVLSTAPDKFKELLILLFQKISKNLGDTLSTMSAKLNWMTNADKNIFYKKVCRILLFTLKFFCISF